MNQHVPVLLKESVDLLVTNNEGIYFDGTVGFGGHSSEILRRLQKKGKLIATDKDFEAFTFCKEKFINDKRFTVYNTSFSDIDTIAKIEFIEKFDGIFVDLGVSSYQLDNIHSGFTFREDAPLDLRMNKKEGTPASHLLNSFSQELIAQIIWNYGEERLAKKIARMIIEERAIKRFESTAQLKNLIEKIVPQRFLSKTLSRVFQALRIYVNNELEELKTFLDKVVNLLNVNGTVVVLTYHSLEDRIVKDKFKYESLECICPPGTPICICGKVKKMKIINSKPITPSENEINENKRSRSAKLRAAIRI
jgi:16S rRNA (cytosine1402-N4)-methyltransferase